ncbi:uncharacterized protein LOC131347396 isoform X10 [Hemibagrus wyckioides]|uniref:uncharacterized protein LOC131347396 isoform X10 n=1 Tax=Hemibagrus wyckioides TaxID=337641 RepID=UPI00266D0AB4|nr:uncharacterized protein LOC131347396 isoform X10 [Hemibagrus wyckioides]
MGQGITRCFVMVLGNTMDSHKNFMDHLTKSPRLREVHSIKDSDVIIAFVPIVSRAGTDIQAAMKKIPKDKPVVLVVLHHTFNLDAVVPDVRPYVNREDVFVVDCLFHEDQGLLRSPRNDDAIRAVKNHLIREDHPEVDHYSQKDRAAVNAACDVARYGACGGAGTGVVGDDGLLRSPHNDNTEKNDKTDKDEVDHNSQKVHAAVNGACDVARYGACGGAGTGVVGDVRPNVERKNVNTTQHSYIQEESPAPESSICCLSYSWCVFL